ncbi:purine permease yicE [Escherichia coli]|uniref:Purine permease yicE n=1 Tax=Escherichia coli TaxID=562 RepID=A0A376ML57_ECOLX|nr:purine permease yicE [Escherichia coli]
MVLALIILLNRQRNPYLRVASLVIAMAAGYALAWFMGMLPESNEPMTQELIMVPTPLYYVLASNGVCCYPDAGLYDHFTGNHWRYHGDSDVPNSQCPVRCT